MKDSGFFALVVVVVGGLLLLFGYRISTGLGADWELTVKALLGTGVMFVAAITFFVYASFSLNVLSLVLGICWLVFWCPVLNSVQVWGQEAILGTRYLMDSQPFYTETWFQIAGAVFFLSPMLYSLYKDIFPARHY